MPSSTKDNEDGAYIPSEDDSLDSSPRHCRKRKSHHGRRKRKVKAHRCPPKDSQPKARQPKAPRHPSESDHTKHRLSTLSARVALSSNDRNRYLQSEAHSRPGNRLSDSESSLSLSDEETPLCRLKDVSANAGGSDLSDWASSLLLSELEETPFEDDVGLTPVRKSGPGRKLRSGEPSTVSNSSLSEDAAGEVLSCLPWSDSGGNVFRIEPGGIDIVFYLNFENILPGKTIHQNATTKQPLHPSRCSILQDVHLIPITVGHLLYKKADLDIVVHYGKLLAEPSTLLLHGLLVSYFPPFSFLAPSDMARGSTCLPSQSRSS